MNVLFLFFYPNEYQVQNDTLLDMACVMKEDVALVHQMPFVCDRKGFPAVLEKVSPLTIQMIKNISLLNFIDWNDNNF